MIILSEQFFFVQPTEMYVKDIDTGITVADKEPSVVKETVATGFVDGNNVLGPTVGNFSMELAIKKAKDAGVGWVVAKGKITLILSRLRSVN